MLTPSEIDSLRGGMREDQELIEKGLREDHPAFRKWGREQPEAETAASL